MGGLAGITSKIGIAPFEESAASSAWTQPAASLSPLLDLAPLSKEDLIAEIRKRDHVILVLDATSKLNLPENSKAVEYYLTHPDRSLGANDRAQYSSPYKFALDGERDRPYPDRKLILLKPDASTSEILHEYGHSLISKVPPVQTSEGLLSADLKKFRELEGLTTRVQKTDALANPIGDLGSFRTLLNYGLKCLENAQEVRGQELDLTRYFYENRDKLGLTPAESRFQLSYHADVLLRVNAVLPLAHRIQEQAREFLPGNYVSFNEGDKKLLQEFFAAKEQVEGKFSADEKWFRQASQELKAAK